MIPNSIHQEKEKERQFLRKSRGMLDYKIYTCHILYIHILIFYILYIQYIYIMSTMYNMLVMVYIICNKYYMHYIDHSSSLP